MSAHQIPTRTPVRSDRLVDELVTAGVVAAADRDRAASILAPHVDLASPADTPRGTTPRPTAGRLAAEIAGYLGGILVVAAAAVFLASQWSQMSPATRIASLLVSALVLAAGAVAVRVTAKAAAGVSTLAREARLLLASTLAVGAAAVAGGAAGVWASHYLDLREPDPQAVGFGVACALMVLGYALVPTGIAQVGIAFTAVVTTMSFVFGPEGSRYDTLVAAALVLALAAVWLLATETGVLRERLLGRAIGGALAILGAQMAIDWEDQWVSYVLLALVGILGFVAYVRTQSWPYLGVGVIALTLAATEAAVDFSDGALGAAGALLVAGAVLLAASGVGLRLRTGVRPAR